MRTKLAILNVALNMYSSSARANKRVGEITRYRNPTEDKMAMKSLDQHCDHYAEINQSLEERKVFVKTLRQKASSRLGFMAGQIEVSDDFDSMGNSEIEKMFGEDA